MAGCLMSLGAGADASAQSSAENDARVLFEAGRQLVEEGHLDLACEKYQAARKLFASAGLAYNLADCYQRTGRALLAREAFDDARRLATEAGRADLAAEATRRRNLLVGPSSEATAHALFDEGRALVDQGRVDAACEKFGQAMVAFPTAGVAYNLGDCSAKLGRIAGAASAFREAVALGEKTNRIDVADMARRRLAEIEPGASTAVTPPPASTPSMAPPTPPTPTPQVAMPAPPMLAPASSPPPQSPGESAPSDLPSVPADHEPPRTRDAERLWLDADLGAAYAETARFNWATLALHKVNGAGPTVSGAAGIRLDALTLGARFREIDLSTFNVWELGGEVALHIPIDSIDAYLAGKVGYAFSAGNAASASLSGVDAGAAFGVDYYATRGFSVGLHLSPEALVLRSASQQSVGLGFVGSLRLAAHF